jgi:N-acetylneuraminate synthase
MTKLINPDRCLMVAEIGINHNGDLEIAKRLIYLAKQAGFDVVKFQKRTVEDVYTREELDRPRESPWGTKNRDQKYGLEFDFIEYDEIDAYCRHLGILWTASPWDAKSVDFLMKYDVPYIKIASASLLDASLLEACCQTGKSLFLSTGMANLDMIKRSVFHIHSHYGHIGCIYHCCSTYPSDIEDLNLLGIRALKKAFPHIPIGYSGHEVGLMPSLAAAVLGAVSIERHITLSRAMYGSDQSASLEKAGFTRLVRDIRDWEKAKGTGDIRVCVNEIPVIEKLRKYNTVPDYY